eukprot:1872076-Rhodomonas_salina.3
MVAERRRGRGIWRAHEEEEEEEFYSSSRRRRMRIARRTGAQKRSEVFAVRARSAAHSRERRATVCRAACSS